MTTNQISSAPVEVSAPPRVIQVVQAVAPRAGALAGLVLRAALASLAAGLLLWAVCFARHTFDSFKAALACTVALGVMVAPAGLLFWLHRALRDLSHLPRRMAELGASAQVRAAAWSDDDAAAPLLQRVWTRIRRLLELRSHLLADMDELRKIAGAAGTVAFLASPLTAVLVVLAAAVSLLMAVGAILASLWAVVSAIIL